MREFSAIRSRIAKNSKTSLTLKLSFFTSSSKGVKVKKNQSLEMKNKEKKSGLLRDVEA